MCSTRSDSLEKDTRNGTTRLSSVFGTAEPGASADAVLSSSLPCRISSSARSGNRGVEGLAGGVDVVAGGEGEGEQCAHRQGAGHAEREDATADGEPGSGGTAGRVSVDLDNIVEQLCCATGVAH